VHGDGKDVAADVVVMPEERLSWPRTVGVGMQHVVAMFGATVLVPLLTGFPPATTIFFSGVGTILFILLVRNRVPSYLGSSFAFIAPVLAAQEEGGIPAALGGIFVAGVLFAAVGLIVDRAGARWIDALMPPIVTGAIVALFGLNLAPVAKQNFEASPGVAIVTLVAVLLIGVALRGFLGRLSIFLGVVIGYVVAVVSGESTSARLQRPPGWGSRTSPPRPFRPARSCSWRPSWWCSSRRTPGTSRPWPP
jgi:xanthine/uracil permease